MLLPEDGKNILEVIKQKLLSSKSTNTKRKSGAADPFAFHMLFDIDNAQVTDYDSLTSGNNYFLKIQENLIPESGSDWNGEMLNKLKVRFVDVAQTELFHTTTTPVMSRQAVDLLEDLKHLDYSQLSQIKNIQRSEGNNEEHKKLQDPLVKAAYLARKYSDHESIIDCFVMLLLTRVGFFEEWLFAFPQLRLKLRFGAVEKQAVPDFVIMDVVSFLRMAVVEDKRLRDELLNSEPQLIAELIALFQAYLVDSQDEGTSQSASQSVPVLGVRVNGLRFFFYHMPDPSKLLASMAAKVAANEFTYVNRLGGNDGLDFLVREDRELIIKTLDHICQTFRKLGLQSRRRASLAPAAGAGPRPDADSESTEKDSNQI